MPWFDCPLFLWICFLLIVILPYQSHTSYVEVSINDLQIQKFPSENVDPYMTMALHGGVLYIGGKGRLYRMDSDDISKNTNPTIEWTESSSQHSTCLNLPQGSSTACYNYIRNIQKYNDTHLLVCGTMALFPENMLFNIKDGTLSKTAEMTAPLCSYDPKDEVTSVLGGVDGAFSNIAGTSKVLQGSMTLVKTLPNARTIRTTQGQGKMIGANPLFTSSFSADDISASGHKMKKLYFVYGEDISGASSSFGSRIAQVCANDEGSVWNDRWTSFLKVPLLCQTNEATPFTFDVVTHSTITQDGILYATFTTRSSVVRASAVCAFSLKDIQAAFHSESFVDSSTSNSFKILAKSSVPSNPAPGDCAYPGMKGEPNASSKDFSQQFFNFMETHPLVATSVQPIYPQNGAPPKGGTLLTLDKQLFTKIQVESVKDKNGQHHDVIFVGTESGNIIKFVSILKNGKVEEVELADYKISQEPITGLNLPSSLNTLYVATASDIVQISTGNCEVYTRSCQSCDPCRACVLARDPMCGWNEQGCVDIRTVANVSLLTQDVTSGSVDLCGPLPTDNTEMKIPETGSSIIIGVAVNNPSMKVQWFNLTGEKTELRGCTPLYCVTADQRLEIKNFNQYSVGSYSSEHSIGGSLMLNEVITFTDNPPPVPVIPVEPSDEPISVKVTSKSTVDIPVEPTNNTAQSTTDDATAVVPVFEPSVLSAAGIIAILFAVVFLMCAVAFVIFFMVYKRSGSSCVGKNRAQKNKKPKGSHQTSRSEDAADGGGSNNSNNSVMKYSYSKHNPEEQKFLIDSDKSSFHRHKQVAEVQAVQANDQLSSVPFMDDTSVLTANEVHRKPPKRTKSIPSQTIRVKLDNDRDIKCNSIHRVKGKSTYLVEIDLPDGYMFEDEKLSGSHSDLSTEPFIGTNNSPESDQIDEKDKLKQLFSNHHGEGDAPTADPSLSPEVDTDSDSTVKAPNSTISPRRAGVETANSSTTSTPRQSALNESATLYPQLSSSYNSRCRGVSSSPKLSPRDQLLVPDSNEPSGDRADEQSQKLSAALRKESTRSDKSPTSTASSASNSSDKFQTPPSSPSRISVA